MPINHTESPLFTIRSPYSVGETANRIERQLLDKQIKVFSRINHAQAAKEMGLEMQPEELIIFGSPKVGTPLMVENPAIGIELPLKILIWQEEAETFVGYQNLDKVLASYQLKQNFQVIAKMQSFVEQVVASALRT